MQYLQHIVECNTAAEQFPFRLLTSAFLGFYLECKCFQRVKGTPAICAFPEPGEVARRGKAAATEGLFSLIILELFSCFQPLSHPRFARLTAPLANGSQASL